VIAFLNVKLISLKCEVHENTIAGVGGHKFLLIGSKSSSPQKLGADTYLTSGRG